MIAMTKMNMLVSVLFPFLVLIGISFSACSDPHHPAEQIEVESDFPGGNIIVDSIVGETIYLRPDQTGTDTSKGKWFYWQFNVRHAQGGELEFVFNQEHVIARNGPAYSEDGGQSWNFLYPDKFVDTNAFSFEFDEEDTLLRFCMTIPYVASDWSAFIDQKMIQYPDCIRESVLTQTEQGQKVKYFTMKHPGTEKTAYTVFLTARHHACEATASYVLEGMISSFLEKIHHCDSLAQQIQLIAIPFVDLDGVQMGEQGKNRSPHDHNRDYLQLIYPSTRAIDSMFTQLIDGTQSINIDLHSPWIKFNQNETLFFIGQENEVFSNNLNLLVSEVLSIHEGTLPFDLNTAVFPFGKDWNTRSMHEAFDKDLLSISQWGALQEHVLLATTLEVPYSNVQKVVLSEEALHEFGHSLFEGILPVFAKADRNRQK